MVVGSLCRWSKFNKYRRLKKADLPLIGISKKPSGKVFRPANTVFLHMRDKDVDWEELRSISGFLEVHLFFLGIKWLYYLLYRDLIFLITRSSTTSTKRRVCCVLGPAKNR
jgi:hypothetical protein